MLFAKQYPCPRCRKRTKSTSRLTMYLNACTQKVPQTAHLHKLYDDPVDVSYRNLEDGSQLLDETNYNIRYAINSPTKRTPRDGLLAIESSSSLREKWFIGNKFPAGIPVSNIKYNHPELKYQNSFYLFNEQLDSALAQYFAELEMTKGNINKFLSSPLMTLLTKKLSYKNADEWIEKLPKIP